MKTLPMKTLGAVTVAMLGASTMAQGALFMATTSNDNVLQGDFQAGDPDVFLTNNSNRDRVGTGGGGSAQRTNAPVLGFNLPTLDGDPIDTVTFTFDTLASSNGPTFDIVVSVMNQTDISGFTGADFVSSTGAINSTLGNGIIIGTTNVTEDTASFSLTGAALTQVQSLYDGAGNPSQSEIWFRLSASAPIDGSVDANTRFNLPDPGSTVTRSLEIVTIPEPSAVALLGLGGLALFRRRRA
jgi:hypothetical protein